MTSNTFPNYQPCYFINQNPSLFGGKQQDYIEKSQTIIRAAAEKIKVCRQEKGDIKKLFFELIAELSDKRAAIAAEHQTMEAEDFGKRRDQHYPGSVPALLLDGVYQEYGTKILNFFAPYLMKMESNGQFEELTKEDKWNGRTTKLQFTVLNNKDLSDKGYTKEADLYLPPYIDKTKLAKEKVWASKEAEEYFEKFLQFKTDSPEEYKRRKIRIILVELARKCPSPANLKLSPYQVQEKFSKEEANSILNNMKSLHVHIILRTEIEGKLYALTEYFTWMYECKEWIEKKRSRFPSCS